MNAARAYRRLKEIEEKKLSNRIMLLKLELEKSRQKIEETRARVKAIIEHKSKIEERNRLKEEEMARRQRETERAQAINQQIRARMDLYKRTNVESVQLAKIEEARRVMHDHVRNKQAIMLQRQQELERAIEMRKLVQQQHMEGRELRERLVEQRKEEAKKAFQQRVQEENNRSLEFERRVQVMEAEERRLIDMIAQAQDEQRKAYSELEQALLASKHQQLKMYETTQQQRRASTSGGDGDDDGGGDGRRNSQRNHRESGHGGRDNEEKEEILMIEHRVNVENTHSSPTSSTSPTASRRGSSNAVIEGAILV